MRDYADQQWREPDPEIVRENETAGIFVAAFIALILCVISWGWFA